MKRITNYPENHWRLPIPIPYSMGVRCGELVCLSGQVDFDTEGNCLHAGDLQTQTAACIGHVQHVLHDIGCEMSDLTKLAVYYVQDGTVDEDAYRQSLGALIEGKATPVLSLIPLPNLAYPGLMVEIDAYAMRAADGAPLERAHAETSDIPSPSAPFVQGLKCGELIFLSSQTARDASGAVLHPGDIVAQSKTVLDRVQACLESLSADPADIVKVNTWYAGGGTAKEWERGAQVRAKFFPEPGPAATGIPLPRLGVEGETIRMDIWAMRDSDGAQLPREHAWPEGHWDWPIHLPFKHGVRCGDLIFVGGQVSLDPHANVIDPGDMKAQTKTSMDNIGRVLAEFGADFTDIVKVGAFYQGGARGEDLHENVQIRSSYFAKPGPASTGVPLDYLAYRNMVIEIEVIAAMRRTI